LYFLLKIAGGFMAEKMINDRSGRNNGFKLPANPARFEDFSDEEDQLEIVLAEEAVSQYDFFHKDIPAKLRGQKYQNKDISWLNNFGMKVKGGKGYERRVPRYSIFIKDTGKKTYVYYDGSKILELPVSPAGAGQLRAELDLGDPPVGWVK
jgi:hypothetical protein